MYWDSHRFPKAGIRIPGNLFTLLLHCLLYSIRLFKISISQYGSTIGQTTFVHRMVVSPLGPVGSRRISAIPACSLQVSVIFPTFTVHSF